MNSYSTLASSQMIHQSQHNYHFPSLPSLPFPKHRLRRLPHQREGQKTEEQGPGTCRRRARPGRELTSLPSGRAGTDRPGETTLTFVRKKRPFQEKCSFFLRLFKKPLTPPLPFDHYVVNFSEGILTEVRKRLSHQLSSK